MDGAISRAGGERLWRARRAIPPIPGTRNARIETGGARITVAGGKSPRAELSFVARLSTVRADIERWCTGHLRTVAVIHAVWWAMSTSRARRI